MMQINGIIRTVHRDAACVARAITPDNLASMKTTATTNGVETVISSTRLRSVIASVDDYLINLGIAEETCSFVSH